MTQIAIEYLAPGALKAYSGNARTHSGKQVRDLSNSIKKYGFINPIVVDAKGEVIAGHGRLLAALRLGLPKVPVIRLEHLTEAEVRAYRLADNQLPLTAAWDSDLLRIELTELIKLDVDIGDLGFPQGQIDLLIHQQDLDEVEVPASPARNEIVTRLGDIWQLGEHRLACGDCRDPALLSRLMQGQRAQMIASDPPYNVKIDGHVGGLGKVKHAEFAMASGEMNSDEFIQFLRAVVAVGIGVLADGGLLYLFIDWRHLSALEAACRSLKLEPINLVVWAKSNAGMGSLYRSQHELILIVKHGKAPHKNNVELGKHGRYRTNLWTCPGMNSFGSGRDELLKQHPTIKPTSLVRDAILDVTDMGDIVFDGFMGSGTTLLAAEQARRRGYGVEIDPKYVDVALMRWIKATGRQPIHADTGLSFLDAREHLLATEA